jgi:hypothetical protein
MPTHKERYARIIAFSVLSPSETCANSLLITTQKAHVSSLELIFDLELALRDMIASIVIYETWQRKGSKEYSEKITIAPVAELLYPLKWRYGQIKKEQFSCVMCDTAGILKEISVKSAETFYSPLFFLYQGFEQVGMVNYRLLPALQKGLANNDGPLLSHALVINGTSTQLRLNRDYFEPRPKNLTPDVPKAIQTI